MHSLLTIIFFSDILYGKGEVPLTKAHRRYITGNPSHDKDNIPQNILLSMKNIQENRITTLPAVIEKDTKSKAIYSYGDVLMFHFAMTIHGHTLKESAMSMDISLPSLRRVVRKFNYGRADNTYYPTAKANAYIISMMMKYIDDAIIQLENQTFENQKKLLRKTR